MSDKEKGEDEEKDKKSAVKMAINLEVLIWLFILFILLLSGKYFAD